MEPHHPKNRKKKTHSYRNAGNKTGSKVTNDATGEIAAEASDGAGDGASAGAGGGSQSWAGTHHPHRRPAAPSASHRIRRRSHHHFWLHLPRHAHRGMFSS